MAKEVLELEVKSNIGAVTKGLDKATKSTSNLAKETKEVAKETEEVGAAAKKSSKGFGLMGKAVSGVGKAFKTLGIVAIVATAFTALKEAMERNQKVMDIVNTVMSTISTTFNQVVDVLSDTVKWVTESSDRFDGLGNVLSGLVTVALTPLKVAFFGLKLGVQEVQLAWEQWMGGADPEKMAELRGGIVETRLALEDIAKSAIDAGKNIATNLGDAIGEIGSIYEKAADGITQISIKGNLEQAKATTAATKAALFAQEEFAKLNAQFLKDAEIQRQIRDDETKTFEERIKANNDLKDVLAEQQKLQREQVQIGIKAAALLVEQNGSDENKLALMAAQNAERELEETITGQLSEQKTNQVGLEKELLEAKREVRAEGMAGTERELQELETAYEQKLELARKANVSDLEITEQYLIQKQEIIDTAANEAAEDAIATEKAVSDAKKQIRDANISNIEAGIGLVKGLAGENKKVQAAALIAENAVGIAKTIIATQSANAAALATPQAIASSGVAAVPVIAANNIAAGISIATSVAATATGLSALGGGGATGGDNLPSGGGGGGGGSETPAPQMMSGAFDISGGTAPEPVKAFVVTDEMTNSQNQLANIRRRATI